MDDVVRQTGSSDCIGVYGISRAIRCEMKRLAAGMNDPSFPGLSSSPEEEELRSHGWSGMQNSIRKTRLP